LHSSFLRQPKPLMLGIHPEPFELDSS
jgi:hypothetical protein